MRHCAGHVSKFHENAATEGFDIGTEGPILLQEAVDGGWDDSDSE